MPTEPQVPQSQRDREAWLRKSDMRDIFAVPEITARLCENGVPASPMIADLASPRQQVQIQTLRAAIRLMSPLAAEVIEIAGWDLQHTPLDSTELLRMHLRTEIAHAHAMLEGNADV